MCVTDDGKEVNGKIERRTRKSKLALNVIFFLFRPIGAVFGLSSLF